MCFKDMIVFKFSRQHKQESFSACNVVYTWYFTCTFIQWFILQKDVEKGNQVLLILTHTMLAIKLNLYKINIHQICTYSSISLSYSSSLSSALPLSMSSISCLRRKYFLLSSSIKVFNSPCLSISRKDRLNVTTVLKMDKVC